MREKQRPWKETRSHCAMWPEDIDRAVALRKEGWSYAEISKKLGYADTTVSYRIRCVLGSTIRANGLRLEEAEKLLAEGKTVVWVADYLGYDDPETLRSMVRKRGIKRGIVPPNPKARVLKAAVLRAEGKSWAEVAKICGYLHGGSAKNTVRKHLKRERNNVRDSRVEDA